VGRWNSNYQRNAPCMNPASQQLWLNLWTWGMDPENSTLAVIHANDAVALTRMADDLIAGTVQPSREILQALEQRIDLAVQTAYRLAESFAAFCGFAWRVCTHQDATPGMLDELAGHPIAPLLLAGHPNTRQDTIDRLVASAMASGDLTHAAYDELVDRASLPLLEALMSHDAPSLIRHAVSGRTQNQRLLRWLSVDPDPAIRRRVVTNPFADAAMLREMVHSDDDVILLIYLALRTTDEQVLDLLAERLCDMKVRLLADAILNNVHASDAAKAVAVMIATDH
jgi:hypothetical protein